MKRPKIDTSGFHKRKTGAERFAHLPPDIRAKAEALLAEYVRRKGGRSAITQMQYASLAGHAVRHAREQASGKHPHFGALMARQKAAKWWRKATEAIMLYGDPSAEHPVPIADEKVAWKLAIKHGSWHRERVRK